LLCFPIIDGLPVEGTRRHLVAPEKKQATFTGEQQRGGVRFIMFVVLGLFSPCTTRRPPPNIEAKGNDASTPFNTATAKQTRQPAAVEPSSSPATPVVSAREANSAHVGADSIRENAVEEEASVGHVASNPRGGDNDGERSCCRERGRYRSPR